MTQEEKALKQLAEDALTFLAATVLAVTMPGMMTSFLAGAWTVFLARSIYDYRHAVRGGRKGNQQA